jgi:hypothetical protein
MELETSGNTLELGLRQLEKRFVDHLPLLASPTHGDPNESCGRNEH